MKDLWLILAVVGCALLLAFCIWGVHFTPDMSIPPNLFQQTLGSLMLCGGPICLFVAAILSTVKRE